MSPNTNGFRYGGERAYSSGLSQEYRKNLRELKVKRNSVESMGERIELEDQRIELKKNYDLQRKNSKRNVY